MGGMKINIAQLFANFAGIAVNGAGIFDKFFII